MEFPSLNTILTLLAFATLAVALYHHSHRRRPSKPTKRPPPPPEAGGAWPILGHIKLYTGDSLPHVALGSQADQHGPIFTFRLGLHRAVVINSPDLAKEVYTTHDLIVSTRPTLTATTLLSYDMAMFGFAPNGAYWREMRKFITQEIQSRRWTELLRHVRDSEITSLIKEVIALGQQGGPIEDLNNSLDGAVGKGKGSCVKVEVKKLFGDMTLNMNLRMVAGKRLFGAGGGATEETKEEARRCGKALGEFFYYLGMFVMRDAVPFLGWLDVGGHEKEMKRVAGELDELLDRWLEEHRRRSSSGEGGGDEEREQDFMDVMLSVVDDVASVAAGLDSDVIIKSACLNVIAAGSETTSVALTWAISLLLNNEHALHKIYQELDKAVGKQRPVTESDIPNLPYLQAVVKETLRLYPPSPLSGPREFTEDCTVGGYRVRKGTQLVTNISKIQRDPRAWSDPLEFRPERFLGRKDLNFKGRHFEFMPFGSGRRSCPGLWVAIELGNLAMARFLQAFEIGRDGDEMVDMKGSAGLTHGKAEPLEVWASPRFAPEVYALLE